MTTGVPAGAIAARQFRLAFIRKGKSHAAAAGAALQPRFLGEEHVELEENAQYLGGNRKCQALAGDPPGNVRNSAFSHFWYLENEKPFGRRNSGPSEGRSRVRA